MLQQYYSLQIEASSILIQTFFNQTHLHASKVRKLEQNMYSYVFIEMSTKKR